MKKPWTLRLIALGSDEKVAYAGTPPRYWTRRGAAAEAARRNHRAAHLPVLWVPKFTMKDPW